MKVSSQGSEIKLKSNQLKKGEELKWKLTQKMQANKITSEKCSTIHLYQFNDDLFYCQLSKMGVYSKYCKGRGLMWTLV